MAGAELDIRRDDGTPRGAGRQGGPISACPGRRRLAVALAAGIALVRGTPSIAQPAEGACPEAPLRIAATREADRLHACAAWQRVASFLIDARGLRLAAPVAVDFAERVEMDLGTTVLRVLGVYERGRRLVRITAADAAWLRDPDRLMFGLAVDAELHTSLIVHELAHAVLLDNFRHAVPGRVGLEYMAYVVQLATMDPATRARVMAGYPEGDFASIAEITEARHLMAPHEFGVRAWRHFAREGHPRILDLVLSGELGIDLPP